MTLTIKGTDYRVRWVQSTPLSKNGGWTVEADEERSYFVKVNEEGMPYQCTCPSFVYCRTLPTSCKHIAAIASWLASMLEEV